MITQEEYIEYSESYTKAINEIEENLKYLYEEKQNYKNQVQSDNSWITVFKKYKNITELTKEIIDELINCIYVHEGTKITIDFRFKDEYENALNYIRENEELSQSILKAI